MDTETAPAPRPEAAPPWRLRQLLRRGLAVALPRRLYVTHGPRASQAVSLTFDDGPDPVSTPRVLDVLRGEGVKATFFVIGERARAHPELLRRIQDEGHAVGHHSYTHGNPATTSARALVAEVRQTNEVFHEVLGRASRLFRPPHGKVTAAKLLSLWRERQTVVLWNRDPKDFACNSVSEVAAWVVHRPLHGGDLVLMHDNVAATADVLPTLICAAGKRHLRFAPLAEWVN